MMKKYLVSLIFVCFVLTAFTQVRAQESNRIVPGQKTELNFYPNPVSDGKIFITSNQANFNKEVEIFDVLGKLVMKAVVEKELNVSMLSTGVYMIKIKENENSTTRKLIIK